MNSRIKVTAGSLAFWKHKSKDTDFIHDAKVNPILNKLIRYDGNFNNKRKILFESLLAGVIRSHPRMLYSSITKVANGILPDFEYAFEIFKKSSNKNLKPFWLCQHFYNYFSKNADILAEYTGCYAKEISDKSEQIDNFIQWLYAILISTDSRTSYQKLLLIREYGNFFIRPFSHFPQFKSLNNGMGLQIIPDGLGNNLSKIRMKVLWDQSRVNWPTNIFYHSRVGTEESKRARTTSSFGIFSDGDPNQIKFQKFFPRVSQHLPGKNLWRVTSTSAFTKNARYNLDMPLISGQSGSIALLLIPAIVMGNLNREELEYFNLNAVSYMIGNGHHSLHEFKAVWKALNITHYIDGDYRSIFPPNLIESHPELSILQQRFPDLLAPKKVISIPSNSLISKL